jgi:ankyrin repeat protein
MNIPNDDKLCDLLKEYADLPEYIGMSIPSINTKGHYGNYPLHVAALRGNREEVTLLIASGADVNTRGEHGYTPLHDAIEQGHIEIVRLLIDHGAEPSSVTDDGITSTELAEMHNEKEIGKLLKGSKGSE